MRVTDTSGTTATAPLSGQPITLAKGWTNVTLQTGIQVGSQTSCVIQTISGAKQYMMAYELPATPEVIFRRSAVDDPLHWSSQITIRRATSGNVTFREPNIQIVNTHPAVVYVEDHPSETVNHFINYRRAADTCGGSWNGTKLVNVRVAVTGEELVRPVLFMAGSIPSVISLDVKPSTNEGIVQWNRSADARGDGWFNAGGSAGPIAHYDSSLCSGSVAEFTVSGRPAVAFLGNSPGVDGNHLVGLYMRATNDLGTSWPTGNGSIIALFGNNPIHGVNSSISSALIQSRPAVAIDGLYLRSSGSPDAWQSGDTASINGDGMQFMNLKVFKGRPVLCGYDPVMKDLIVAKAKDQNGILWDSFERVSTLGDSGRFCSMVVAEDINLILIVYQGQVLGSDPFGPPVGALRVAVWH